MDFILDKWFAKIILFRFFSIYSEDLYYFIEHSSFDQERELKILLSQIIQLQLSTDTLAINVNGRVGRIYYAYNYKNEKIMMFADGTEINRMDSFFNLSQANDYMLYHIEKIINERIDWSNYEFE